MAKVLKQTRLDSDLVEEITRIADEYHDSNFTAAVESLLMQAISIRNLPEQLRWQMVSGVKRAGGLDRLSEQDYISAVNKITDGLYI